MEDNIIKISRFKKNIYLAKIYFLTSLFTFTGGIAMLSSLKREICDKYKLMDEESFYNYAAISQTLPGVIAVTNACFVGKKINGVTGMIVAAVSAILPAFVFMVLATILFQLIAQDGPIYYALDAVRAVSAAFIFSAALTIAKFNLKSAVNIILAVFCFLFTIFQLLGALELIVIALIIGIVKGFSIKTKKLGDE